MNDAARPTDDRGLDSHRPVFTFRTLGGSSRGPRWIFDGDEPIACLEHQTVDQPEEELRYFSAVPMPVNLRDLKLRPGQRPLMAGVQLYWKLGAVITTELLGLDVQGEGTDQLTLTVVTADPQRIATSRRVLNLTYDAELRSYVYNFECHLALHQPETLGGAETVSFEYSDPWYTDLPAPSQVFDGMWPKRSYTHLLCEQADGSVWKLPLNHNAMRAMPGIDGLKRDGLFLPAFEAGHNPALQVVGDSAARTSMGVCNWGYDIHMRARYSRAELYVPQCERFRIVLCPDDQARALLHAGGDVPPVTYKGMTSLPLYEPRSSFAAGIELSQPTPGLTDPFLWEPDDDCIDGAEWCHDCGRSDSHSLKISKTDAGPTRWIMLYEGQGSFCGWRTRATGYRISVWIRTDNVGGAGAYLGMRWMPFHQPARYPLVASPHLTGTNDWTRVTVELPGPPPDDVHDIAFALEQDGPGTTWFDDLEVEQI